jgi:putative lipoprotein
MGLAMGLAMVATGDAAGSERLLGATWLAEDIQGGGVIDTAQSKISIAAGGKVTGSGACNRLFGTARIDSSAVAFSGFGLTRMACAPAVMHQESKFVGALMATRTFRFEGPYLKFYDGAGAELIRFTRLP